MTKSGPVSPSKSLRRGSRARAGSECVRTRPRPCGQVLGGLGYRSRIILDATHTNAKTFRAVFSYRVAARFRTTTGRGSNDFCRVGPGGMAGWPRTTAASSTRSGSSPRRASPGGICPSASARGTRRSTCASTERSEDRRGSGPTIGYARPYCTGTIPLGSAPRARAAVCAQYGSRRYSRASSTKSACPLRTIVSA